MAATYSIDKKRQADRAVALLGLHAAEECASSSSACLTDEELAALVDRQYSAGEQDKALGHLVSCADCYRRWLALSEIIDENVAAETQTKNKIYSHFRAKQLAWAGSLLAAAASVVLFINISGDMKEPMLQPQVPPTFELNMDSLSEVQSDKEQKVSGSSGQTKPLDRAERLDTVEQKMEMPAAAAPPAPAMEEMPSKQTRTAAKRKTHTAAQKSVQMKRPVADKMVGGDIADIIGAVPLLSVSTWLADIQLGCRQNNVDRQFWNRRYLEGRNRLYLQFAAEEKLVNDLLPLLQQLTRPTGTIADICTQITARLDVAADR